MLCSRDENTPDYLQVRPAPAGAAVEPQGGGSTGIPNDVFPDIAFLQTVAFLFADNDERYARGGIL